MKDGYAYDPIRNEDVQISNCREMPHDFDIENAVHHEEGDRHARNTRLDAKEHDRLLSADLSHDPSEGCQGSYSRIVDEDCQFCGYDRATHTTNTMGGVHELTCRRCGSSIGGESGKHPPKREADRVDNLEEYAECEGPLTQIGYLTPAQSMFGAPTDPIYAYDYSTVVKWVRCDSVRSARSDDLVRIIDALLESGQLDVDDAIDLLGSAFDRIVDADAVGEIDPIDRSSIASSLLPEGINIDIDEPSEVDWEQ